MTTENRQSLCQKTGGGGVSETRRLFTAGDRRLTPILFTVTVLLQKSYGANSSWSRLTFGGVLSTRLTLPFMFVEHTNEHELNCM